MDTLTDKLLSTIASQSRRFGVVNFVLDAVVSKILPQVTAAACGSGVICYYECQSTCAPSSNERFAFYAASQDDCNSGFGIKMCDDGCRYHCAF